MFRLFIPAFAGLMLALPAAAQTLDRIQETKELRLGYRTDAAPLSFQDADGNPAGYSPLICAQLGQAVANALQMENLDAVFVPVDASTRFDMVASGEVDLLCGAATITLRRRNIVDFSIPTYIDGTAVMLPQAASGDIAALGGQKVGVRAGTTTEEALTNSLAQANVAAEVISYDSHTAGMSAMEDGDVAAYFADQSILLYLRATSPQAAGFKVSNEILSIEKHGLAMVRGDTDFRLLVDSALSRMYADGTMSDIFRAALPGVEPGRAIKAMVLTSPILP